MPKVRNLIALASIFLRGAVRTGVPYEWQDRIVVDPEALEEKAIAQGTRLSVEFILVLLANGWTAGQILARSPLKREGIKAALKYDAEIFKEKAYPLC